ncbi:hypothetical protein COE98_07480 [Bacillus wiedmannii]|nr:hypothetical protein CN595_22635 [Bacillus wiedmannii]PEL67185.1 hypothetical protein CN622_00015 [Bacillus wiedmannii]PEU20369.1 hypothetical protein CN526_28290 [Bacillus wiedmannii]PHB44956.1 hypothetical protein COE82_01405 [Bacillus wiedmannii]PHB94255.1 hypothetical protein COE98_07480 [Bacillus wiedmannii]
MAYSLQPEIQACLTKIDFIKRYKALSKQFPDRENTFENYENEKVIAVFESLGYKARFMKKENFLKVGELGDKKENIIQ